MNENNTHIDINIDIGKIINGGFIITICSLALILFKWTLGLNYDWIVAFIPIIIGWFHIAIVITYRVIQAVADEIMKNMFNDDDFNSGTV
jgi:hypothetical protein